MVDKVRIQNFKSIVDLTLDLGRVNIIIGANGCGKTNILEAITLASAANQWKLDNEFLGTRLRTTSANFMLSAFEDIELKKEITLSITEEEVEKIFTIENNENKWIRKIDIPDFGSNLSTETLESVLKLLEFINSPGEKTPFNISSEALNFTKLIIGVNPDLALNKYLIYSPEESKLRTFSDDTYISPFGRKGEGLFQHLKQLTEKKEEKTIHAINEGLFMLDWFDGFNIPDNLLTNEYKLAIGDRYLNNSLRYFDQRSTNEGFLYLLFYLTLFNSKETPEFFAVDNIETSFNPKLCTKLTEYLIETAKKNNKQVILTTHSPYVLDALDLSDDEQRLFVARRDIDGHTRITRVPHKEERTNKLSDIWMKGLIGGLPDNF